MSVCGRISADMVASLRAVISPEDKSLIISSQGGEPQAAMDLFEVIRSHNIKLKVRGVCASACATFIFTPAKNVEIEANSIVAFHHTNAILKRTAQQAGLAPVDISAIDSEERFLRNNGVSGQVLTEPAAMVEPLCVGVGKGGKPSGVPDGYVFFQTRYNVYVPDIDTMKRYRNRGFVGYWPKRADEAGRILNAYGSSPISVAFGRVAPEKVSQLVQMKSVCAIS